MRKILEAKLHGFSNNNNIAATYGTSKNIVHDAVEIAATNKILTECTILNLKDALYRTIS